VAADERKEIEIVLVRERPAITVHVTDDRGYAVDRAHIRAISLTTDVSLRRTTFSNEKGDATVEDAAGIRLRLEVSANGYGTVVKTYDASPEDIKIQLERGLRLQGEVTGRGGRERVKGARVTLYLPTGARDVTTGDDGVFRADDISAGPLRLRVEHDDYVGVEKTGSIWCSRARWKEKWWTIGEARWPEQRCRRTRCPNTCPQGRCRRGSWRRTSLGSFGWADFRKGI
jgi:hypothetical protein